ncbi:hypothetical protein [Sphingomonas sp. Leaf22]|nr:hypothetical protein [Sphingomonas sp. Leaf22]
MRTSVVLFRIEQDNLGQIDDAPIAGRARAFRFSLAGLPMASFA